MNKLFNSVKVTLALILTLTLLMSGVLSSAGGQDKTTNNFLKVGNNAEKKGAPLPNWQSVKEADSKLLSETLKEVKNDCGILKSTAWI